MEARWTIAAAGRALRAGTITSVELTQGCLNRIAAGDATLQAFVTVTAERALADAHRADQELHAGADRGPLHGIPIALKDLILTEGITTTGGSAVLADYTPPISAEVARDLARAGTVLLGKTNTHEFAWGVFTPPTRNPWNTEHIPGGSSGGSAAAVAAGEALGAIGTDTGGSVRIPSACCGVTGFKPSYDLVSRTDVIQLSSSFDHVGPIARTVEDCALLLDEMVKTPKHPPYAAQIMHDIGDTRLGVLGGPWADEVDATVLSCFHDATTTLAATLPVLPRSTAALDALFAIYVTIMAAEAGEYHQRMGWYPERSERYTLATRERLANALQLPAVSFIQAMHDREQAIAEWNDWMDLQQVDALLAPTLPIPAPRSADTSDPALSGGLRTALLRLTFPFSLMGLPALSVPCGFTTAGLPVGMQIITRRGDDALALRIGHAFQARTDWHKRIPPQVA